MEHITQLYQRKKLREIKEKRKLQKQLMYNAYIKPLENNIKLLDKAIKGEISLTQYVKETEALNKYMKELLGEQDGSRKTNGKKGN